jgi:hypothetical protein
MLDSGRERKFINDGAKFNFTAEECRKFRTATFSAMGKAHARRHQTKARQLPACTDQDRHKKLDLMPIQVSAYSDIVDRYANISAVDVFQSHAFIDGQAVSRRPLDHPHVSQEAKT